MGRTSRRALGLACLGLLALLASPRAAFASKEESAIDLMNRGTELYQSGDFAGAAIAFGKAHELLPDKANPYRWLGLTKARLHRCADANVYLEEFIKRVPAEDPRTIEAISMRDQCRAELSFGTVVVESQPAGAEVRLDDDQGPALGVTPYSNNKVIPGAHVIFLRAPGYAGSSKSFKLNSQESVRLDISLAREPGVAAAAPVAAAPVAATAPAVAPASSAPSGKPKMFYAGVALIAVGAVVAIGGGLGFFAAASGAAATINMESANHTAYSPDADQSRGTFNTLTAVSAIGGVAVAIVGAAITGVGLRSSGNGDSSAGQPGKVSNGARGRALENLVRVTPIVGPSVAGAALSVRF